MIRHPSVEVVVFGFQTWLFSAGSDSSTAPPLSIGEPLSVYRDILSVDASNMLTQHTGSLTFVLRDRPAIGEGGDDNYPDPATVRPSVVMLSGPYSRSFYGEVLFPQMLVMVRFMGNVFRQDGGPLTTSSSASLNDLSEDMDIVALIDSVLPTKTTTQNGVVRSVTVTCRTVSKVLVDDNVVYFPHPGIVSPDKTGEEVKQLSPILIGEIGGAGSGVFNRSVLTLRRFLGKVNGPFPELSDDDPAKSQSGNMQDFMWKARRVKDTAAAVFRLLHSTNIVVSVSDNQAQEGKTGISIRPVPVDYPEHGLSARYSGLLALQIDDELIDVVSDSKLGAKKFPTISKDNVQPAGEYEKLYAEFVTGQGSIISFFERLVERPFIEMFSETVGRRQNLVIRAPILDYEDIVETWRKQDSYSSIFPQDFIGDSLVRDTSDVSTLFRMDLPLFGQDFSMYRVGWVGLQELVDRFGVRMLSKTSTFFDYGKVGGAGKAVAQEVVDKGLGADSEAMEGLPEDQKTSLEKLTEQAKLVTDSTEYKNATVEGRRSMVEHAGFFATVDKFRNRLVRWYAPNPLFKKGTITIRCPEIPIRVGTWVTNHSTKELFYIEGWRKKFDYGKGNPTAVLNVSRGFHRVGYAHICRRSDYPISGGRLDQEYNLQEWMTKVYPNIARLLTTGRMDTSSSIVEDPFDLGR